VQRGVEFEFAVLLEDQEAALGAGDGHGALDDLTEEAGQIVLGHEAMVDVEQ